MTEAVCAECGGEMSIPGLMKIYKIGKAPLSLALGFGEVTIPGYLEGQMPFKEYSDIVKAALASPAYMKQKLMENRNKLTDAAYKKPMSAADSIESLFSVSDKMLRVIAYVFEKLEEVTPLMLQKLLYFIQGVYLALYGKPVFAEDCRAWIHSPVYPEVFLLQIHLECMVEKCWRKLPTMKNRGWRPEKVMGIVFHPVSFRRRAGS